MSAEAPSSVTCAFKLATSEGSFTAHVDVPAGQTNLTQLLPVLQELDNALIAGVVSHHAQAGVTLSCKAGCGACCRQMVPLSIFEAEALADWIRSLPEEQQRELAGRFHRALKALAEAGIVDRLVTTDWFSQDEPRQQLAIDYFRQGIPCPFLEEESCSIHPIRPLICREYLVSSPPRHCTDPALYKPTPMHVVVPLSRGLYRLGAALEQSTRGWIPLLFLFAWMESGVRPSEHLAGEGPAVLYRFIQSLDLGEIAGDEEQVKEESAGETEASTA
jgi:Fe-S-cluster containining protein